MRLRFIIPTILLHLGLAGAALGADTFYQVDTYTNGTLHRPTNFFLANSNAINAVVTGGGGGAVSSVNGQVGPVSLTTDDVPEGTTNLYWTDGRSNAIVALIPSTNGYIGLPEAVIAATNAAFDATNGWPWMALVPDTNGFIGLPEAVVAATNAAFDATNGWPWLSLSGSEATNGIFLPTTSADPPNPPSLGVHLWALAGTNLIAVFKGGGGGTQTNQIATTEDATNAALGVIAQPQNYSGVFMGTLSNEFAHIATNGEATFSGDVRVYDHSVYAVSFFGAGDMITGLNADNLTSGTVPMGRVAIATNEYAGPMLMNSNGTARYWSFNGSAITNLNASALASGTVPMGRVATNNASAGSIMFSPSGNERTWSTNLLNIGSGWLRHSNSAAASSYLDIGPNVIAVVSNGITVFFQTNGVGFTGAATNGTMEVTNLYSPNIYLKGGIGARFVYTDGNKKLGDNFSSSSALASSLSDETGVGKVVFSGAPTVTNLADAGAITATNGVFGAYGCLTMATGTVTHTSTQIVFTNWAYTKTFGSIGTLTNTSFVVTNAGDYRISFGANIGGSNGDVLALKVLTNEVVCTVVSLNFTATATAANETGFKEFVVTLPANCRVSLGPTNSASTLTVQNACLNVKGAN